MSDAIDDKDQAKIDFQEADKQVKELIQTGLKKLAPVKAVELTQKLALHTAISALAHLPTDEIIRHLNVWHEKNMQFVPYVLETLGVGLETPPKGEQH